MRHEIMDFCHMLVIFVHLYTFMYANMARYESYISMCFCFYGVCAYAYA